MNPQPDRMRAFANLAGDARWRYRAAGHVVRIFERDERGRSDMIGRVVMDSAADRIPGQQPVFARDRTKRDAGERRRPAHLVVENVAARFDTASVPGRAFSLTQISLPIVPEGTKSAASFPRISAARSCRRLTVG